MPTYDLVLRGGLIADGRGGEPFIGDVAVKGDRIVAVGHVPGEGGCEVDVTGRLVTPGFIDIHTHYDGQAIWSDRLTPSSNHGVTTVVTGNCGVGFAPCRREDQAMLVNVMEGVEDIPGLVMTEGLPWTWETFPEYMDELERRPRDIDVAAFLPHSPLRIYAMGERGANREPATAADLTLMRALAKEAAEAGAIGYATSSTPGHRTADGETIPSYQADMAELEAIGLGLAEGGGAILQITLNGPDSSASRWGQQIDFIAELLRRVKLPATVTFGARNDGPPDWRIGLERVDDVARDGIDIRPQVFPRPVGMLLGLSLSTNPFAACPSYIAIAERPLAEKVAIMRDPAFRARLLTEAPARGSMLTAKARAFEFMFPFDDPPNYEPPLDSSMAARGRREGITPEAAAYDYLLEDDGRAILLAPIANFPNGSLDTVAEIMAHPRTILGLGDGGAHYGAICDASFPTFTLSYWARDRAYGRISVGQAVRLLSHDGAEAMGLKDRGVLAPGYKADINVIDFDRLKVHAPVVRHDLPGGGMRLDQTAEGYDLTLVSGEIILRNDRPTDARPGRLIRGVQPSPEAAISA